MQTLDVTLEAIRPTAERVTRLAHALFGGVYADIIWQEADKRTRMVPFEGDDDARFPSKYVMATREPLWIEDFANDPQVVQHGLVTGTPDIACFVGVPILCGSLVLGVLGSVDRRPRPTDAKLLRRLTELADLLADAFLQVQTVAERERTAALLQDALEETARSEQRLRLAAELAKVHVWELDHGRKEATNGGAAQEAAGDYAEAKRSIWETVHPDDQPAAEALWAAHLAGGPPLRTTYRLLRADGSLVWVESAAEAVRRPDGSVARVVGAIRSIEAEKQAERELIEARDAAEAADAAKTVFLATISHEIRTPLNGILGMVQAMGHDDLPAPQRDRLKIIRQSGESLLAILNDVLDLSKISAGKLELESIEFDLVDLTAGAHAAFASVAEGKGVGFNLTTESAHGIYLGDPVRVRQILYNLISNALKFTDHGGVEVRVSRSEAGLELVVTDSGIGIPADRQQSLFQPFVQADASTTRRFGGTGLGLSICRELVVAMGGAIHVKSTPGEGSTFRVELPLRFVRPSQPEVRDLDASDVTPDMPPLRVLAAEDNAVNQLVLKALLSQVGIDPVMVENGRLTLEAWRAESWDLILMDAQMPEMDGIQATMAIRAAEAQGDRPRTPIIALTANAMTHQAQEYLAAGMDGVVVKPIQVAQLFAAIQEAVNGQDTPEDGRLPAGTS